MGIRLSALADGEANNFRILRLFAACSVVFSHAYIVNGGYQGISREPLVRLTGVDFGALAVDIFFITSGFLVSRSLLQRRDVVDFLIARILRITPALVIAVMIGALVVGPATTELPLATYFRTKIVYTYILIDSLSISPFHFRYELPGVFEHLPVSGVINASLWSMPWEIWMYGALLLLFLVRGLGKTFPILLGIILCIYAFADVGFIEAGKYGSIAARLVAFFFVGVAMELYAARIIISSRVLAIFTMLFLAVSIVTRSTVLLPEWLAYVVMFVAYAPSLVVRRWSTGPDFSYGIYIYAYIVQQLLVWMLGPHPPLLNALLAVVLTLPVAAASWYGIEAPALALKARLRARLELFRHRGAGTDPVPDALGTRRSDEEISVIGAGEEPEAVSKGAA
jgi:peptidoglycan/LPS O-acetylase OafA/YrhL